MSDYTFLLTTQALQSKANTWTELLNLSLIFITWNARLNLFSTMQVLPSSFHLTWAWSSDILAAAEECYNIIRHDIFRSTLSMGHLSIIVL
jgi:hypothetical protein